MAVVAVLPSGPDVSHHAWPEDRRFCVGGHHGYALVSLTYSTRHNIMQRRWDNYPVLVENHAICQGDVLAVLMEGTE